MDQDDEDAVDWGYDDDDDDGMRRPSPAEESSSNATSSAILLSEPDAVGGIPAAGGPSEEDPDMMEILGDGGETHRTAEPGEWPAVGLTMSHSSSRALSASRREASPFGSLCLIEGRARTVEGPGRETGYSGSLLLPSRSLLPVDERVAVLPRVQRPSSVKRPSSLPAAPSLARID